MNVRSDTLNAFSLVELSITLVILGLLIGGILAGQSLVRAAELRAIPTEYRRYITASHTFRDKYFAYPGDFRDATKFWGFAGTANAPGCISNSGISTITTGGTCDGNGDAKLTRVAAGNTSSEIFQFWRHLALAGLIEGTYSGISGAAVSGYEVSISENTPASRLANGGWSLQYLETGSVNYVYNINYQNAFYFGGSAVNLTTTPILTAEEAWNIDTKLDDGRPGRGKVIARNIIDCTTDSNMNNLDSSYALDRSGPVCAFMFPNIF